MRLAVGDIVRLRRQRTLRRIVYVGHKIVAVSPRLRETSVVGGKNPIVFYPSVAVEKIVLRRPLK